MERNAREQGIWLTHVWGERIEDRGSQITFSALGQPCAHRSQGGVGSNQREEESSGTSGCRRSTAFGGTAGGASSVDISEKNVDKSFAVRELADILGITVAQIVFVGDRMDPDGNDYPAAKAGTRAVKVTCPNDTVKLCGGIIASLSR